MIKPRNPMAIHIKKRKAGSHEKPFKSIRKKEKQAIKNHLK